MSEDVGITRLSIGFNKIAAVIKIAPLIKVAPLYAILNLQFPVKMYID